MEKPSSLDGNDPETNGKRKSILKRSPSVDSNTINSNKNIKPIAARKASVPQTRTIGEKARVKDSLEVINTKFLKELDTQVKYSNISILSKSIGILLQTGMIFITLAARVEWLYCLDLSATRHPMILDKSLTAVCLGSPRRCILITSDIYRPLWLASVYEELK
jgi:hypothetical protein